MNSSSTWYFCMVADKVLLALFSLCLYFTDGCSPQVKIHRKKENVIISKIHNMIIKYDSKTVCPYLLVFSLTETIWLPAGYTGMKVWTIRMLVT